MEFLASLGKILVGLFGLGIMIFIHELGHLVAAKLLGVKVEVFSIGYGKKLIGFRWGDTTYQLSFIPFGGFCKMKGEHLFLQAVEENLDQFPADPENYYTAAPWKRILIALSGPLFNLGFAFLLFSLLFGIGFNEYSYPNRIILLNDLSPSQNANQDLPASKAGLKTGDRIVAIDDQEIHNFADLQRVIHFAANQTLKLKIEREGQLLETEVTPLLDREQARGYIGILPYAEPVIDKIAPTTAALNPWLKKGDRLLSLADRPIASILDIYRALGDRPSFLPARIERKGEILAYNFYFNYANPSGEPILGFSLAPQPWPTPRLNLFQALSRGVSEIGFTLHAIFKFFTLIPARINIQNSIGGPVLTTFYLGEVASSGLEYGLDQAIIQFLSFIGSLSVILFFMNLLPLPILDGGYCLLFLIEWLRRKPWRPRFLYRYQIVGFVVMVLLIIFVLFSDINKLLNL